MTDTGPDTRSAGPTVIALGVVRRAGAVLVGRREAGQVLGGYAEFPGGKCRRDEDPADCARREVAEETGLDVRVARLLAAVDHQYPHGRLRLYFYLCEPTGPAAPRPPYHWLAVDLLDPDAFPPANREVIRLLQAEDN
jgi:mutator protein MutT